MKTQALNHIKSQYRNPETPGSFFLSLEGIEGSGKTTQIKEIEAYCQKKGLRVVTLREPGGTIFGEKLREAILKSESPLHPLAECHLFLASRAQLLKEKILPFLLEPKSVVILDRYIDSTLAYQGKARKLGYETVLTLHQYDPLNLLPHRTYFLDISLETSMERQKARGNEKDYFESEKNEFYQNLVDGYRDLSEIFPERIMKIDASKTPSEVTALIIKDLEKFLS
ncbi:dTMP kinase [Peredibacter starrii]|uniref:Thymidylate kinase n=1 Tax=Peredibacter starrii TaxID=28202 RepID=A0AAX4HKB2_9BACT|nr:dTMP kinase [Peredibacter starrii]WPU63653.1 dTMP kinase [Peredibacter starrii]